MFFFATFYSFRKLFTRHKTKEEETHGLDLGNMVWYTLTVSAQQHMDFI